MTLLLKTLSAAFPVPWSYEYRHFLITNIKICIYSSVEANSNCFIVKENRINTKTQTYTKLDFKKLTTWKSNEAYIKYISWILHFK